MRHFSVRFATLRAFDRFAEAEGLNVIGEYIEPESGKALTRWI